MRVAGTGSGKAKQLCSIVPAEWTGTELLAKVGPTRV